MIYRLQDRVELNCFLWLAAVVLPLALAGSAISTPQSESPLAVVATIESTNITYQGLGKATGTEYKGTSQIKVLDVLSGGQPHGGAGRLVLLVEEKHKKPTWETKNGRSFLFVLQSIAGTSQYRVLDVAAPDPEKARKIKARGQMSLEELNAILHPSPPD